MKTMLTSETKPPVQSPPRNDEERQQRVRKLTLFSVLPATALLSQVDAGFVSDPADRRDLMGLWGKANQAYNRSGTSFRSFVTPEDVRRLDHADGGRVAEMKERAKAYAPYDSHPTDILNVRISKLVTPQITINLSRAERRAFVGHDLTELDLFEIG